MRSLAAGVVLFIHGGSAVGLCHFGIHASAVTLWVPFIVVDEVVCFSVLLMEEFGCWGDAVR